MTDRKNSHPDHPFEEVLQRANEHANEGRLIFQKYTCRSCGARLTMEEPNAMWEEGTCDQPQCAGIVTDIRAQGCNYMMITHPQRASLPIPRHMVLHVRDEKPGRVN